MQNLLDAIGRIVSLTSSEERALTDRLQACSFQRKELLLREGDPCRAIYFIRHGSLRCYYRNDRGKESTVMFAFGGWWLTDMNCFVNALPAQTTIQALVDTECYRLGKQDFDTLFHEVPKFERYFRILMQNAYIREQTRAREAISLTSAERYQRLVDRYPELEQRVSQKHIASYLGISPEFLSTMKRERMRADLKVD